jgi:hypothetical protein
LGNNYTIICIPLQCDVSTPIDSRRDLFMPRCTAAFGLCYSMVLGLNSAHVAGIL